MKRIWITVAGVLLLSAAGCARTEDPAQGGFFSGLANMTDGTYDRRQQARHEALENEQDKNLQQQRELERTNAHRDALAAERARIEADAAGLDREVAALKAKLARAKSSRNDLSHQADVLQGQIDVLRRDSFSPPADKQARLQELQKQKAELEKQIDTLIGQ